MIGIRFLGETDVTFIAPTSDERFAGGSWVVAEFDGGAQIGRVVIDASQVIASSAEVIAANVRVATDADLVAAGSVVRDDRRNAALGGPGRPIAGEAISREDDRYRALKAGFPSLGATVATDDGEGEVVAVNASRATVTLRHAGDDVRTVYDVHDGAFVRRTNPADTPPHEA